MIINISIHQNFQTQKHLTWTPKTPTRPPQIAITIAQHTFDKKTSRKRRAAPSTRTPTDKPTPQPPDNHPLHRHTTTGARGERSTARAHRRECWPEYTDGAVCGRVGGGLAEGWWRVGGRLVEVVRAVLASRGPLLSVRGGRPRLRQGGRFQKLFAGSPRNMGNNNIVHVSFDVCSVFSVWCFCWGSRGFLGRSMGFFEFFCDFYRFFFESFFLKICSF